MEKPSSPDTKQRLLAAASELFAERGFAGATMREVAQRAQAEHGDRARYSIVGIDEADAARGRISWISPLARCLLNAREGDCVRCPTPSGTRELDVVAVEYLALD